MLPSFVIGLREGLEAALIVGIIAAFLRKQGRRDLLRWVLIGVGIAVVLCLGVGIALRVFSQNLPQHQQEGLETVIAVLAVGMVTYMVVWMKRHSRDLKGQLEGLAAEAMTGKGGMGAGGRAMVAMAFLAVIREGFETVVFLLAAFNETAVGARAGLGATLGILIAVGLGYGIYRGGVRLNLSRFFRITGFVLVLVAAGLVVNAFHTAHEAGWVNFGQTQTVDLSWLVQPGTVQASLLTGMLGLQPRPVVVEVVAWLIYLVPVGLYVLWPQNKPAPVKAGVRGGLGVGLVAAVAAVLCLGLGPSAPAADPVTTAGDISAQVQDTGADAVVVRTESREPVAGTVGEPVALRLRAAGNDRHGGLPARRYAASRPGAAVAGRPATLSIAEVAARNGSRVPFGIQAVDGRIPVTYRAAVTVTAWRDVRTNRVLDVAWRERVTVVAGTATNNAPLSQPVADVTRALPAAGVRDAVAAARSDHDTLDTRAALRAAAGWCIGLAVIALVVALAFALLRRRTRPVADATVPEPNLVKQ